MTTIYQALAAVMSDVQAVGKKERNQAQGFQFRGIDAVVNAVGPVLRTHGVIVVPQLVSSDYSTVEIGQKRTMMGHARIVVRYEFFGPEGDSITSTVAAEAMDSGDKATAKAMSVAFRTCLLQALCLPTDEPDPDHDLFERSAAELDPTGAAFAERIRAAATLEALDAVGAEIAASDVSETQRAALRSLFAIAADGLGRR